MYSQHTNSVGAGIAQAQPSESLLSSHARELGAEIEEIMMTARRLQSVADRILGTRPEAVEKEAASPPIGSAMQALDRSREYLQRARSVLADATERLERL